MHKRGTTNIPFYISSIFFLISGYVFYINYKSLDLKKFRIIHSKTNFKDAALATAKELRWNIMHLNEDILIARMNLSRNSGFLRITIIRQGNDLYANSSLFPSLNSHPFEGKANRNNIRIFNNNLIYATKGIDIVSKIENENLQKTAILENESEWTFKNTSKRILVYFFLSLLLLASWASFSTGLLLGGVLFAIIPVSYLIMDWTIITREMIKKKNDPND